MEPSAHGLAGQVAASPFERRVTAHQLRIFKAVADRSSFSRAAEDLHLSQPAVSHQVKALSIAVGAPLFEDIGRQIQLSETGRLLYEHASLILSDFEIAGRAIDEHHGLRGGLLRLVGDTTVGIYVLPDLLGAFKQAHPGITPHLDIGNRQHVYGRLLANQADFAVVGRTWLRPNPPMVEVPFLPNELIAVAAPTHPLAGERRVTLARLAGEPMILREPGSGTRETAEEALSRTGRPMNVAMELASNGAIKRAVARGLGVAILSRYAVSLELRIGTVVELPVAGFPLHRQWHLVYPRNRRFGPVGTAFLSFALDGRWRESLPDVLTTE
ncbi:MAG: LysR family transcriptional regulator [Chloroflexota bacterium]|nr:LysR family transcriptional regulator [Chloroflexota bacterium]